MSSSLPESPARPLWLRPAAAGTACCAVSALGYTAANICLRQLNHLQCDPTWAICNKELIAVIVVGPWLLWQGLRGLPTLPGGRRLALLVLVGLATQLSNVGVQWAQGVVGMAVTVPTVSALLLTTSASLGWFVLREHVSRRSAAAIGLLLAAVLLLGLGAEAASQSAAAPGGNWAGPLLVALAVAMPCLAGVVYAVLSITIRHCVTDTTRLSAVVLVITGMGVVVLGPLSAWRLGAEYLRTTPPDHFAWMAAAGTCNLIAFFALSKGLQLATVLHVNMLNASQVALAAIAGVVLFSESLTGWLVLGVALTIAGIFSIGRPAGSGPMVDQHA